MTQRVLHDVSRVYFEDQGFANRCLSLVDVSSEGVWLASNMFQFCLRCGFGVANCILQWCFFVRNGGSAEHTSNNGSKAMPAFLLLRVQPDCCSLFVRVFDSTLFQFGRPRDHICHTDFGTFSEESFPR